MPRLGPTGNHQPDIKYPLHHNLHPRGTWVPYTSLMTNPASVDYLALGTSVLLAVRWKMEISETVKVNKIF